VANDGSSPARIGIRQLDFPGWRAWLDGQPAPVEVAPAIPEQQTAPGFIVLSVPPGEHTLGIAFGPSTRRLAGMVISFVAVLLGGVLLATRLLRSPAVRTLAIVVPLILAGSLVWRGVRPMLGPAALLPLPTTDPTAGIWRASDLDGQGNARTGLVVNVGEAVRRGGATISSPSGSALGVDRFVDVRQLTVSDEDDPERGAAGTSRRQWLYLHPPSDVAVDVALPVGRRTWLQSALTLDPAIWRASTGDGVRFVVDVAPLDALGQPATALDRAVNPRARTEERQWLPVEVDLSPWAGQVVRITLRTLPRDDLTNDWAGWGNPVVVVREQARAQPAPRTDR
jgi:hypothetical protein